MYPAIRDFIPSDFEILPSPYPAWHFNILSSWMSLRYTLQSSDARRTADAALFHICWERI
jgi:hypothetical protein